VVCDSASAPMSLRIRVVILSDIGILFGSSVPFDGDQRVASYSIGCSVLSGVAVRFKWLGSVAMRKNHGFRGHQERARPPYEF
jgi:hypothetical protein